MFSIISFLSGNKYGRVPEFWEPSTKPRTEIMKIKIIIIFLSFCVCSMHVIAQDQDEIISPELSENAMELLERINQISISEQSSLVSTEQFGDRNTVDVLSSQEGQMNTNAVFIAQFGNDNSGIVKQNGHGHALGVLQDGNENRADIIMNGNNIQSIVTQVGDRNVVEENVSNSYIETATRKIFLTEQNGDDNNINFEIATMDFGSVEIFQDGNKNNATVDVEGSPSSLYRVEQAGGATVNISQSAFYMPMKSIGE